MTDVQALLSSNMRRGRERLGFSQARVAGECGISNAHISDIEKGVKFPSAKNLSRIARVLGMRPAELFYEADRWELRERHDSLARYAAELKDMIGRDIDDLTRRYMLD
ncbi:MAG: helix-turn-helix domain-containing protein [Spirochaetales bacterium]